MKRIGAMVAPILLLSACTSVQAEHVEVTTWTPTPQPGVSRALAEGESWKAPPVWAIHLLLAFPEELQGVAVKLAMCESRWDSTVVGLAGERGVWQIHTLWLNNPNDMTPTEIVKSHGLPVTPDSLAVNEVNAEIASYILVTYGSGPWSTSGGCPAWRE